MSQVGEHLLSQGARNERFPLAVLAMSCSRQDVPKDPALHFVVIRESYRYCMIITEISVLIAELLLLKVGTSRRVFDVILPKDAGFAKNDMNCSGAHARSIERVGSSESS